MRITGDSSFNLKTKNVESLDQKPQRPEPKPVPSTRPQRTPSVQRKLDKANDDLAELTPEALELLLSGRKQKA
ncbi:hypothetical protein GCM10027190_19230 [Spirosoma areae]